MFQTRTAAFVDCYMRFLYKVLSTSELDSNRVDYSDVDHDKSAGESQDQTTNALVTQASVSVTTRENGITFLYLNIRFYVM